MLVRLVLFICLYLNVLSQSKPISNHPAQATVDALHVKKSMTEQKDFSKTDKEAFHTPLLVKRSNYHWCETRYFGDGDHGDHHAHGDCCCHDNCGCCRDNCDDCDDDDCCQGCNGCCNECCCGCNDCCCGCNGCCGCHGCCGCCHGCHGCCSHGCGCHGGCCCHCCKNCCHGCGCCCHTHQRHCDGIIHCDSNNIEHSMSHHPRGDFFCGCCNEVDEADSRNGSPPLLGNTVDYCTNVGRHPDLKGLCCGLTMDLSAPCCIHDPG